MDDIDDSLREPNPLADEYRRKVAEVQAAYDQALLYARDLSAAYHAERSRTRELQQAWEATIRAMVSLIDVRDSSTEQHSHRVAEYTRAIAAYLGKSGAELEMIRVGALVHDIGKIGVPDQILRKAGPLTPDEWIEMRRHPEIGWRALSPIPYLRDSALIVLHHHEFWNGMGYPQGLHGAEICIGARIFTVADALDAMTSDRPYRRAMAWDVAVERIRAERDKQFDPEVVAAFLDIVGDLHTIFLDLQPTTSGRSR